jgi:hypothetical protein
MLRRIGGALIAFLLVAGCSRGEQNTVKSEGAPAGPADLPATLYSSGAPEAFVVLPGNTVEPGKAAGPDSGVVIRSTSTALNPKGDGNAAVLRVSDQVRNRLAGKTVRVTIRARSAAENGAPFFRAFYSRPGVGASPWAEFRPTADFRDFTFDYASPADVKAAYSTDLVGIWADPEGKGRGVEVISVSVDTAPAQAAAGLAEPETARN